MSGRTRSRSQSAKREISEEVASPRLKDFVKDEPRNMGTALLSDLSSDEEEADAEKKSPDPLVSSYDKLQVVRIDRAGDSFVPSTVNRDILAQESLQCFKRPDLIFRREAAPCRPPGTSPPSLLAPFALSPGMLEFDLDVSQGCIVAAKKEISEEEIPKGENVDGKSFRDEDRGCLFRLYHPGYDRVQNPVSNKQRGSVSNVAEARKGFTELLVSVNKIQFNKLEFEPFFLTLCLYDIKKGARVTENFHVDLNSTTVLGGHLAIACSAADSVTKSKSAIFQVANRHDSVYLVVRVERMLLGDPSVAAEPYLKVKPKKNELKACQTRVAQACHFLSDFRQSFAWAAVQLFPNTSKNQSGSVPGVPSLFHTGVHDISTFFLQYESLNDSRMVQALREMVFGNGFRPGSKVIPNSFLRVHFTVLTADEQPANRVNPSSIDVPNTAKILSLPEFPKGSDETKQEKLEELPVRVLQLHQESNRLSATKPYVSFVNNLYVYLESVSFQKFRNIAAKVQVRLTDTSLADEGLKVICGKSSTTAFTTFGMTQVSYHRHHATPCDEFKIVLPLVLKPKLHLFVTFYQVKVGSKPGKKETIGYTVLPLTNQGEIKKNGVCQLPVAATLPSKSYWSAFMDGKETESTHFRAGGANCVQLKLQFVSSIYNQDESLKDYFLNFPSEKELVAAPSLQRSEMMEKAHCHLENVKPATCIRFMCGELLVQLITIVELRLLNLMSTTVEGPQKDSKEAAANEAAKLSLLQVQKERQIVLFRGFATIAHRVSVGLGEGGRVLLSQFCNDKMSNSPRPHPPLFAVLPLLWLSALEAAQAEGGALEQCSAENATHALLQHAWFYFDLMLKSMVLYRDGYDGTESPNPSTGPLQFEEVMLKHFVADTTSLIACMVRLIYKHRSLGLTPMRELLKSVSSFCADLYLVLPREVCTTIASFFMETFCELNGDPVLGEFKFTFYKTFFSSKHFALISCIDKELTSDLENEIFGSHEPSEIDFLSSLKQQFKLLALFVRDLELIERTEGRESLAGMREKAGRCLRLLLTRIDYSDELSREPQRSRLAIGLLPFAHYLIEFSSEIFNDDLMEVRAQRDMLISFLWTVRHCPGRYLTRWFGDILTHDLGSVFEVLIASLNNFRYPGILSRQRFLASNGQWATDCLVAPEAVATLIFKGRGTSTHNVSESPPPTSVTAPFGEAAADVPSSASHRALVAASGAGSTGSSKDLKKKIEASVAAMHQASMALRLKGSASLSRRSSVSTGYGLRALRAKIQQRGMMTLRRGTVAATQSSPSKAFSRPEGGQLAFRLSAWEGCLVRCVHRTVISFVLHLRQRFPLDDLPENAQQRFLELLATLLMVPSPSKNLLRIFPLVDQVTASHGTEFATTSSEAVAVAWDKLVGSIFRRLTLHRPVCRQLAIQTLEPMLSIAFGTTNSLSSMRTALTEALSQLVQDGVSIEEEAYLQQAMSKLEGSKLLEVEEARQEDVGKVNVLKLELQNSSSVQFETALKKLFGRLSLILRESMEIQRQQALGNACDMSVLQDVLLQISKAFNHHIGTRLGWLNRLAKHHQKMGNRAEAGHVFFAIANLLCEARGLPRLHVFGPNSESRPLAEDNPLGESSVPSIGNTLAVDTSRFTPKASLSLTKFKMPFSPPPEPPKFERAESSILNRKKPKSDVQRKKLEQLEIAKYFELCIDEWKQATLYEQLSRVCYEGLQPIYIRHGCLQELSAMHLKQHEAYSSLIKSNEEESRMLGTYYRVGFYGTKFGSRNGHEYVYKMPKITRLAEITDKLRELYEVQTQAPVKILPDSGPVDIKQLNADECVMQITFIAPYFEGSSTPSFIEQNTNLAVFMFSTPFTVGPNGGVGAASCGEQFKRKTLLFVENAFPCMQTSQEIVQRKEIVLSPIESSDEDVRKRTEKLLNSIRTKNVNGKALGGLLAGSVATQVHGGCVEIANVFLGSKKEPEQGNLDDVVGTREEATPAQQQRLRQSLRSFLEACGEALQVNAEKFVSSSGEEAFQKNLVDCYEELSATLEPMIAEPRAGARRPAGRVRFEQQA